MSKITAIRAGKRTGKRVNMFLNGQFALSLETEVAAKEGLKVGQELSANQVEALAKTARLSRCLNAAYRLLSYRPRSEAEIRERLRRRDFDENTLESVITRLKEQGLVDDTAFAQFWKESRESSSPRSQWLTKRELRKKGVADDIINQVVSDVDDNDSAYRAVIGKARSLPRTDYAVFRRRLGEYLKRRGFGYGVINHAVNRIWQELKETDR